MTTPMRPEGPRRGACALALACLLLASAGLGAKDKGAPRGLTHDGRANLAMAETLLRQKQPERAMAHARKAQDSDPGAPEVQLVLARIHQAAGEERKTERAYKRALK